MRRTLYTAALILALLLAVPTALANPADAAETPFFSPSITRPIPSGPIGGSDHDYPFGAAAEDLSSRGYAEQEHFFSGTTIAGDYTSRMIVRKPTTGSRFSGNVFVEWLNVSNNYDLDALWLRSSEQILRNGDAYIGISAQSAGINGSTGLKAWSPTRYSALTIPPSGVAFAEQGSFQIFAQALQGIRHPQGTDVLEGLTPGAIIATGTSQSAGTLLAYSTIYGTSLRSLVDGYLITALSTSTLQTVTTGMPLPLTAASLPFAVAGLGIPVMVLNTETDPSFLAMPESNNYRLWEVAGTTHSDYDIFTALAVVFERDFGQKLDYNPGCGMKPYSRIPFRHAQNAAMAAMVKWVRSGIPIPAQPRFHYNILGAIVRDPDGNALGGVRLPEHAAPTATNRPENTGPVAACVLPGQSTPFTSERLHQLYPRHADYVREVQTAVELAQNAGTLLPEDGHESLSNAKQAHVP